MNPLCSDRNFSVESTCMIHAHIRRRDNIEMWRGLCVSMMIRIENIIDDMLNTRNKESAWTKICRFKAKVRKDSRGGTDANLFFAALAVIHDTRNIAAHPSNHAPRKRQKKTNVSKHLMDKFNSLADMYNRPYLKFKHDTAAPNTDYKRLKWMNGLAQVAVGWITDYSQT